MVAIRIVAGSKLMVGVLTWPGEDSRRVDGGVLPWRERGWHGGRGCSVHSMEKLRGAGTRVLASFPFYR